MFCLMLAIEVMDKIKCFKCRSWKGIVLKAMLTFTYNLIDSKGCWEFESFSLSNKLLLNDRIKDPIGKYQARGFAARTRLSSGKRGRQTNLTTFLELSAFIFKALSYSPTVFLFGDRVYCHYWGTV